MLLKVIFFRFNQIGIHQNEGLRGYFKGNYIYTIKLFINSFACLFINDKFKYSTIEKTEYYELYFNSTFVFKYCI